MSSAEIEFVRNLFGQAAEDDAEPPESTRGNVVPDEGRTPAGPPAEPMRDFTRALFGYDD